jgi:hypothetical protein
MGHRPACSKDNQMQRREGLIVHTLGGSHFGSQSAQLAVVQGRLNSGEELVLFQADVLGEQLAQLV